MPNVSHMDAHKFYSKVVQLFKCFSHLGTRTIKCYRTLATLIRHCIRSTGTKEHCIETVKVIKCSQVVHLNTRKLNVN